MLKRDSGWCVRMTPQLQKITFWCVNLVSSPSIAQNLQIPLSWKWERWKTGAWTCAGSRGSMETASSPATILSTRTSQVCILQTWRLLSFQFSLKIVALNWMLCLADTWDHMYTTRNISPTNNQANIVELHPACVYSIRMYSYNKIGRSLPSKELTISTEEAREWTTVHLSFFVCYSVSFCFVLSVFWSEYIFNICFKTSHLQHLTDLQWMSSSSQWHLRAYVWLGG